VAKTQDKAYGRPQRPLSAHDPELENLGFLEKVFRFLGFLRFSQNRAERFSAAVSL